MTEERIAELGKIDVKSLPLNEAIKYVKVKVNVQSMSLVIQIAHIANA